MLGRGHNPTSPPNALIIQHESEFARHKRRLGAPDFGVDAFFRVYIRDARIKNHHRNI